MSQHLNSTAMADRLRKSYGSALDALQAYAAINPWDGHEPFDYVRHSLLVEVPSEPTKMLSILLTFDYGYHASGWWRNAQYDRCWHLSMTVPKFHSRLVLPQNVDPFETPTETELGAVARAFFGDEVRKAWIEPPASKFDAYRTARASSHTWHVRLFTDREGQIIKPEGEVYNLKPWPEADSPPQVFR